MLDELLRGRVDAVWRLPDGSFCVFESGGPAVPLAVLPGSFNPLHDGHRQLQSVAERILSQPVCYELSVTNVDKPPLDDAEVQRRARGFEVPLLLTNAATFQRKCRVLGDSVSFVVGVDTAERILADRYYDSADGIEGALQEFSDRRCRFLVAGRAMDNRFLGLRDLAVPAQFAHLFEAIAEHDFRVDVSSTHLRGDQK